MIEISRVNFAYGKIEVFKELSINIEGKIIGLIGENGAGKSTLVKLIFNLMNVNSGHIRVDGMDVCAQRNNILQHMGVMFEQPSFPSWYALSDFLEYVGCLRGLSQKEARDASRYLLNKFNLEEKSQSKFQALSAGMKQKFAIAVALIGNPKYVFLDEPTANLDVSARSEILDYIHEIAWKNDMNVIILSHILHDLEKVCDQVVILHNGKIKANYSMSKIVESKFIREYVVKVLPPVSVSDIVRKLKKTGVECIVQKGMLVEFSLVEHSQLLQLTDLNPTPRRSLLEQVFMDSIRSD